MSGGRLLRLVDLQRVWWGLSLLLVLEYKLLSSSAIMEHQALKPPQRKASPNTQKCQD